ISISKGATRLPCPKRLLVVSCVRCVILMSWTTEGVYPNFLFHSCSDPACIFIERERYGTCDPLPPLLQRPPSAVLPRSASMALLHPGADRAHVRRGDAPHRKYLSEMYDDDARDAA